jgi:hypothetical protein
MSTLNHPPATTTTTDTRAPRWSLLHAAASVMITGGVLLLGDLLINPGPGIDNAHKSLFVSGHLFNAIAYLVLVLGLPALAASLGRSLGVLGALGYASLVTRYALSTGSQLFQAGIYHTLAQQPGMRPRLSAGGDLSTIYGTWDDTLSLILGLGMLALVPALWRAGRAMRAPSALLVVVAVTEIFFTPLSLIAVAVLVIWLGARIVRHGDVREPFRQQT